MGYQGQGGAVDLRDSCLNQEKNMAKKGSKGGRPHLEQMARQQEKTSTRGAALRMTFYRNALLHNIN